MALLHKPPADGDILVVGDGNFSFSCCLAATLSNSDFKHKIVATSFDRRDELENDGFAQENIRMLASFGNIEVIHGVDATKLDCSLGSRKFARIIFNFPHSGGKSNIKKCRQLLVDFFESAAGHVFPATGEVCVSLCQGQGGTPEDRDQRGYGNTWQVVEQAAKAKLMLKSVSPFTSSEYPLYKSAGYRGLLKKGFHTRGGLTHIFIHGIPLKPIPEFGESSSGAISCCHQFPTHPINMIRKRLEIFFKELSVKHDFQVKFEIFSSPEIEERKLADSRQQSVDKGMRHLEAKESAVCSRMDSQTFSEQCQCLLDNIQKTLDELTTGSFIITDTITSFSLPVTKNCHPVTEHMFVVRRDVNCILKEEILAELESIIDILKKEICPNIQVFKKRLGESIGGQEQNEISNKLLHSSIPSKKVKTNYGESSSQEACSTFPLPSEAPFCLHIGDSCSTDTRIHEGDFSFSEKCDLCKLEVNYCSEWSQENRKWFSVPLLELQSCRCLIFKEAFLTYGLLKEKLANSISPTTHHSGWIIEFNLDAMLLAMLDIPDARLLHSCESKFLDQFTSSQELSPSFIYKPFNLHPPSYVHDISFWLEAGTTEVQFLETIYQLTQNCVQDVIFRERYYDKDTGRVSYNYRMIYCRCDGPLSHLDTVKMQNLLRRNLMALGFGLK